MEYEINNNTIHIDHDDLVYLLNEAKGAFIFRSIKGKTYPFLLVKETRPDEEKPKNKYIGLSRVILKITDPKIQVTYKDGNPMNVQRENMVETTREKVFVNRKKRGTKSKYRGVSFRKDTGRWSARFKPSPKHTRMNLGSNFKTEEEAAEAYNRAIKLYLKDDSLLNEIKK